MAEMADFPYEVWFHKGKILKIFLTFFNVSDTVIFGPFFAKFSAEKNMARKFSDPKFVRVALTRRFRTNRRPAFESAESRAKNPIY